MPDSHEFALAEGSDRVGHVVQLFRPERRVGVQCDAGRGVAELHLQGLRVRALGDREARVCVAQTVYGHARVLHAGRFDGLVPILVRHMFVQTFPPRVARNSQSSSPMPSICALICGMRNRGIAMLRAFPFFGVPSMLPPCPSSVHVRPILARRLAASTSPTVYVQWF